jgi:hypothetical protein
MAQAKFAAGHRESVIDARRPAADSGKRRLRLATGEAAADARRPTADSGKRRLRLATARGRS